MFRARCKKRAGLLAGLSADTYIYQGQGGGGGGGGGGNVCFGPDAKSGRDC